MRPFILLVGAAVVSSAAAKPVWPDAGVKLEARQGAAIEERGGTVYVQTGCCRPNTWPNVAFVYREPADLSAVRAIKATFTNCTDQVLRIALKVKGKTVQGQLPEGGCNIPAHGERTSSLSDSTRRFLASSADRPLMTSSFSRSCIWSFSSSSFLPSITDIWASRFSLTASAS